MRFGHWRGVMFTVALFSSMVADRPVSADDFHVMPKEVLARDLNTGQPYFAPPIPWGHYAKDGLFDHYGKNCPLGKFCLGKNCKFCCGKGMGGGKCGHGLFNHCGKGSGDGCGDPGCGGRLRVARLPPYAPPSPGPGGRLRAGAAPSGDCGRAVRSRRAPHRDPERNSGS